VDVFLYFFEAKSLGQFQWRRWEGVADTLPAIIQRIQEALFQGAVKLEGPDSLRWVPSLLGGEAQPPEA